VNFSAARLKLVEKTGTVPRARGGMTWLRKPYRRLFSASSRATRAALTPGMRDPSNQLKLPSKAQTELSANATRSQSAAMQRIALVRFALINAQIFLSRVRLFWATTPPLVRSVSMQVAGAVLTMVHVHEAMVSTECFL